MTWAWPLVGRGGGLPFAGPDIQVSFLTHGGYGNELKYWGLVAQAVPFPGLASYLQGSGLLSAMEHLLYSRAARSAVGETLRGHVILSTEDR